MVKRLAGVCLALVVAVGVAVPSIAGTNTVSIGILATISGDLSEVGTMGANGAKLAVEQINRNGGIKALGGAKLNLVIGDTTSDYSQSVLVAQRLLSNNKLTGLVGAGVSGMAMAVQPVIERAQVPIVTGAVADNLTTLGYKYIFQFCPKGSQFGAMQAEFLRYLQKTYGLNVDKVAIVYENTAYGQSTAKGIRAIAEKAGFKIVIEEAYPKSFTDAGPLVTKVRAAGAEAIFPVSYTTDAALILSTMNAMRYNPVVVGGGAGFIWPEFSKALGKNAEGVFSVGSWSWDTKFNLNDEESLAAIKAWEKEYKGFMPEMAGEMYSAVYVLKEAIEAAKSDDPKEVRNALAKIKITKGAGAMMQPGVLEFNESGWNKHVHPTMIQWQNGVVKTVYPLEVTTNKIIWPLGK
jgi:branched-chain amino acid transport system substrate-binding protein